MNAESRISCGSGFRIYYSIFKLVSVGIIGSGNVAWHLAHGFIQTSGIAMKWVYGRNETTLSELSESLHIPCLTEFPIEPVDLVLICVSDDSIQDVLNQLPSYCKVAYTSGTVSLDKLEIRQEHCGVFYPLQSFTRNRSVDLKEVPFLIEATNAPFADELERIARLMSNNVQRMDSEQRKQLHIAAVFSNNFVNHLFYLAQEHLKDKQIDKNILYPLICETINKMMEIGPYDAQSGPARRNDKHTIESHLSELKGRSKEVYALMTESILKTYSK